MREIMIAAGGTGGHINPALALAEQIQKKHPEYKIVFFGSDDRMEAELIPNKGYEFIGMTMQGTNGGILAKIQSIVSLLRAQRACKKLLKEHDPIICIGFGNYISVPIIMAAHRLGIPTMIHEQNSSAGKANKLLGRYVDAIVGSYAENVNEFPKDRFRYLGNPEATAAVDQELPNIYVEYHFDIQKPLIFFVMGSLGSSTVSKVIDETVQLLNDDIQILIASGKSNNYSFSCASDRVRIVPYVNGKAALQQATITVTRAGATTMSEITALGAASILVPSPYVPNNHQVYNALELVNQNAGLMIEEKDLNPQLLAQTINDLLADPSRLETMRKNALSLGKPNAAHDMVAWMEELIHDR